MNEPTKKRKRGIETTQRLLDAAAAMFADKGYDNVSVRELAQAVDIKESSLYNHFPGKEAILTSLLNGFAERVPGSRPSLEEVYSLLNVLSPEEALKNTILRVGQNLTELDNNTARIIYSEMYRNEKAAALYRTVIYDDALLFYTLILQRMMDQGLLKSGDAGVTAEVFYTSILESTMEFAMARGDASAMTAAARRMMRTVDFIVGLLKP